MNETLPVYANFDYDPIGSFRNMDPYSIAFCYYDPKRFRDGKDSFIIKGGWKDVERRIENTNVPMLVFPTFWRHGRSRSLWPHFYNCGSNKNPFFYPIDQRRDRYGKYFHRRWTLRHNNKTLLTFRRVPRKWLPDYNELFNL